MEIAQTTEPTLRYEDFVSFEQKLDGQKTRHGRLVISHEITVRKPEESPSHMSECARGDDGSRLYWRIEAEDANVNEPSSYWRDGAGCSRYLLSEPISNICTKLAKKNGLSGCVMAVDVGMFGDRGYVEHVGDEK